MPIPALNNVDSVYLSAGKFHSALIDTNRNLYVWGSNKYGQLGVGHKSREALQPIYTQFEFDVTKLACGYRNSLLLTGEGVVYGCGSNDFQQITTDSVAVANEYTLIEELVDIERIFCTDVMMAMARDYSVYLWGGEYSEVAPNSRPVVLEGFEQRVINAALGEGFAVLIDRDLFVYSAGINTRGQLGYSDALKENAFGVVDKLCQNPLKSITCGRDFVIGLGGISVPNANKMRTDDSQFNLRATNSQMRLTDSHVIAYGRTANDDNGAGYNRGTGEVFQSFNTPNQTTNRAFGDVPSFPYNEGDDAHNNKVSEAVEGFRSEVYSILKDIKEKSPNIDRLIDKSKLHKLKMKEDLLNDILNSYAKDYVGREEDGADIRNEILAILRGIIQEYNKHITFKGYKKTYKTKLTDLKVS